MLLRASFASLSIFFFVACSSISGSSEDCGSNACGACQTGFVASDRCEGGEWQCDCVPASESSTATSPTSNGEDAAPPAKDSRPVRTCQQMLASPTTPALCVANDWGVQCEQGCLACTCNGGTWGCTTSASCFDAGTD